MQKSFFLVSLLVLLSLLVSACELSSSAVDVLGDYTWIDRNGNGIQEEEEKGLKGVKVRLFTADGTLVAQTTSVASGSYGFANVSAGEYYLEFEPPERSYDQDFNLEPDQYVVFSVTLKNQGQDDLLDSDVNQDTLRTDPFRFDPASPDKSLDAGFIPRVVTPEQTPTPEKTPAGPEGTPTLTPTPTYIHAEGTMEDTYVRAETPSESHLSEEYLMLKGMNSRVYLVFRIPDASGLPPGYELDVSSVWLELYIQPDSNAAGAKIWVRLADHKKSGDWWLWDKSLTWNKLPDFEPGAPEVTGIVLSPYTGEGSMDKIDVTPLYQFAAANRLAELYIVIGSDEMNDAQAQIWYSREWSQNNQYKNYPMLRVPTKNK